MSAHHLKIRRLLTLKKKKHRCLASYDILGDLATIPTSWSGVTAVSFGRAAILQLSPTWFRTWGILVPQPGSKRHLVLLPEVQVGTQIIPAPQKLGSGVLGPICI
jgi:hypothetical protein